MMAKRNFLLRNAAILVLTILMTGQLWARDEVKGREVYFDTESTELRDSEMGNPFTIMALFLGQKPTLDSKKEPHTHAHVFQVIVDGGNGVQDPPNADGSPGGDDSLAWGNFNMFIMGGLDYPPALEGKTGTFATAKYFIPYLDDRVYFLRLWEGTDVKSAPYYQDSSEYVSTSGDQGGGMVRISSRLYSTPQDVEWAFGPSKPRPKK